MESTVTVTVQYFTVSVLSCLPSLHTKHLLKRYNYDHCFSANCKEVYLWRNFFRENSQEVNIILDLVIIVQHEIGPKFQDCSIYCTI